MEHQPSSSFRDLRNKITFGSAHAWSLPASPVAAKRFSNISLIWAKKTLKTVLLIRVIPTGVGGKWQHVLKERGINISRDTTAAASSWDINRGDNYLIKEWGSFLLVCHVQNSFYESILSSFMLFERALWKLRHRKRGFPSSPALSEWEAGSAHPQLPQHFSKWPCLCRLVQLRTNPPICASPINLYHLFFKITHRQDLNTLHWAPWHRLHHLFT